MPPLLLDLREPSLRPWARTEARAAWVAVAAAVGSPGCAGAADARNAGVWSTLLVRAHRHVNTELVDLGVGARRCVLVESVARDAAEVDRVGHETRECSSRSRVLQRVVPGVDGALDGRVVQRRGCSWCGGSRASCGPSCPPGCAGRRCAAASARPRPAGPSCSCGPSAARRSDTPCAASHSKPRA